ncbi:somatolactin alpha [Brachyhypopomus gauderio]|uniref:somatolactin alpha n=1 Tax=Brachyhypopomus gauderio TaxID=698409 RepID=UPI0040432E4E
MCKLQVGQAWLCAALLCLLRGLASQPLNCVDDSSSPVPCTSISQDKLLDRVIQHAELIYRITEDTCVQYEELYVPYPLRGLKNQRGGTCTTVDFPSLGSKQEIQQISDQKLLHAVLMLAQSWMEPLTYLQSSLKQYDHAPDTLVSRLKWVSDKLTSLEQGVVVLISQMLEESSLTPPATAPQQAPSESYLGVPDSTLHEYNSLMCLKKDAHKMETLLKLFKCRKTDKLSCIFKGNPSEVI